MAARVLVTGGAGYIGAPTCAQLRAAGHEVVALDCLLHDQSDVAAELERQGVEMVRGDLRDGAARAAALEGVEAVVHLAAIVGDPACAADPQTAAAVNEEATRALIRDAQEAGVRHFVFASTCSNYGRMEDPTTLVDEDAELRPVSLYARQKVAIELELLEGELPATCLRFATIFGVAPRMRFDLTVNEFTRDLFYDRDLEIFGSTYWRPYLHVRDAAAAISAVLAADRERVIGHVFNVGRSDQNFTKRDLVEAIRRQVPSGRVHYVQRDEDPRDYRVAFDKVHTRLGFVPERTVEEGIGEVAASLAAGRYADPFDERYRNTV